MIWAAIGICLAVSFLFSGMEAGILSVNRVRLRHRAKLRDPAAITLSRLLARPERCIVSVLFVTNFMNITAVVLSTQEVVRWCGTSGYLLAGILWLPLYLLVVEVLPKSLFRRFPYRALAALTGLLRLTDFVLSPLLNAGAWTISTMLPSATPHEKKLFIAREDFKHLTFESERQGMLGELERRMIHNVVDVRSIKVSELMIPLPDAHMVLENMSVARFLEMARQTRLNHFAVKHKDGEITGLVSVMEVLLGAPRDGEIAAFIRRIVSVNENESIFGVLEKLRASRTRLAVVQNGKGEPLGTVSFDDLTFRIVKPASEKPEKFG